MNRDAEVAQAFLVWLLQDPTSDRPWQSSGDGPNPFPTANESTGVHISEVAEPTEQPIKQVHQPIVETPDVMQPNLNQPNFPHVTRPSVGNTLSFELGELSAVQDRFYTLLKRRLRAEIERKPPLFPWENEILDYDMEPIAAPMGAWIQVSNLVKQIQERLPVPMPEQVLANLFSRCQTMVHGSLQQGTKLVQAVETLFPGEDEMLNYLARLVLAPSFRDGGDRLPTEGFPRHYDAATPVQQMALSLIAASEILDALTLKVSTQIPEVERQWPTSTSPLTIIVNYRSRTVPCLRAECHVPSAAHLALTGIAGEARTYREDAGCISVELFDILPQQTYRLIVQLDDKSNPPLDLAIQVEA